MIKVEKSSLPPEKIKKIREWLDREECAWLENCVASEIADVQADATNVSLREPHKTIGDPNGLSSYSINKLKEAAVLQTFLDVLKRMRAAETKFETVKLTIF